MVKRTRLIQWLQTSIEVQAAIIGPTFALDLAMRRGFMVLPHDIFQYMASRRVIYKSGSAWFFDYQTDLNAISVTVMPGDFMEVGVFTVENTKN